MKTLFKQTLFKQTLFTLISALLLGLAFQANAATDIDADLLKNELLKYELLKYQEQWARIQYDAPKNKKEAEFEQLARQLQTLSDQHPTRAEPMIWQGIVLSTWAGAKGGLGALSLVKDARNLFEKSMVLSADALQGSAYTSLGSLYYQVPGWPISFGDDEKARKMLGKAISINPAGIDSNYFYGDYWLSKGEYEKAQTYFNKALEAADRPQRPRADAGRRQDIRAKLAIIAAHSKHSNSK